MPSANADEIRKAYKKLCLKFHPDKAGHGSDKEKADAQKKFLEVQKAHEVLSDTLQRRTFDAERARSRGGGGGFGFSGFSRGGGFGFGQEDDLFSAFYAARGGPKRR